MRGNSIKDARVNAEVLRELNKIVRNGIKGPRIHPITNVVSVEITPDLKYCKVYISVLGNKNAAKAAIEGLKSVEGYVYEELTRRINLRSTPELKFVLDQSIECGANMSELIDKVIKDLHQGEGQDEEGEEEEV